MNETVVPETISIIISIIALVVFFVMASNVGATVRQLKETNKLLKWQTDIKVAELNGTLKKIVCGACNKNFTTISAASYKCPHCNATLQEKAPEVETK